jgi:micrococcal nuclease
VILFGGFWLLRRLGIIIWLHALVLTPKARRAEVLSHVDGDTVRVSAADKNDKSQISIRLIGVDTPESRRSLYMDIAPFGKQSADYSKERLPKGKKVILVYDQAPEDKFGRQLAYLFLPNGEFFNASLVKNGYAWADRHPPNLRYAEYFEKLQQKAQQRGLGLWKIYNEKGDLLPEYKKTSEYKQFLKQHPPRKKDK